jgi:hypothetical protein
VWATGVHIALALEMPGHTLVLMRYVGQGAATRKRHVGSIRRAALTNLP